MLVWCINVSVLEETINIFFVRIKTPGVKTSPESDLMEKKKVAFKEQEWLTSFGKNKKKVLVSYESKSAC